MGDGILAIRYLIQFPHELYFYGIQLLTILTPVLIISTPLQKFVQPAKIDRWAVANFSARCDVRGLVKDIIRIGATKGIVSSILLLLFN